MDSGGAQALSAADIEAMKAEGAAGADIVAALTANSATFAAKTEFSQDKYRWELLFFQAEPKGRELA